jgi:hypothetical protein
MIRRFSLLTLLALAAVCGLVGFYLGSQQKATQPWSTPQAWTAPNSGQPPSAARLWEPPGNVVDLLNDAQERGGTFGDIAVLRLLAAFEEKDAESVLGWVMSQSHDNELSFDAQNIFWKHWAQLDIEAALAAALKHDLYDGFIGEMAEVHPQGGLNFFMAHWDDTRCHHALSYQAAAWAEREEPKVTQWAMTIADAEPRTLALSAIAKAVAQNSSARSALAWWDKLPADESRREAFDGMITAFRDKDAKIELDDRVELLQKGLKLGVRDRGFEVLLSYWLAYSKPSEGAEILNALPPETNRGRTVEDCKGAPMINLMAVWGRLQSDAAGEWLLRQARNSPHRDEAIAGYVLAIAEDDPAAAAQWMEFIQDPLLRQVASRAWH